MSFVHLVGALCLSLAPFAHALAAEVTSRRCIERMTHGEVAEGETCPCGYHRRDPAASTFWKRLTPSCQKVLRPYRRVRRRRPRLASPAGCGLRGKPSNPVFVQNGDSETFVMCTVAKCGSSYWRMLLLELVLFPRAANVACPVRTDPHRQRYPNVWAFEKSILDLENLPDSFMIVRNPFTRVLSGFLNKIVWSDRGDTWTRRSVFDAMGLGPPRPRFTATPDDFLRFLQLLNATGVDVINSWVMDEHFRAMWRDCDMHLVHYDFLLKLEDMACWYPCLVHGLRLERFVHTGWINAVGQSGKVWAPTQVGAGPQNLNHSVGCSGAQNTANISQSASTLRNATNPASSSSVQNLPGPQNLTGAADFADQSTPAESGSAVAPQTLVGHRKLAESSPSGSSSSQPASSCFWAPGGLTCEEYQTRMDGIVSGSDAGLVSGGCASLEGDAVGVHSTGAKSQVHRFYSPEAIAIVQRLYALDFQVFGYSPNELGSAGA